MRPAALLALSSTIVLTLCTAVAPARANWSPNGIVTITDFSHSMFDAHLAKSDTGELLVWAGCYAGGAGHSIRGQAVHPDGSLSWGFASPSDITCGIPDGTGGFFYVESFHDVWAYRVNSGGLATGWPVNGLVVAGTTADEEYGQIVPDGTGGGIVAYLEYPTRIKVKHVLAAGTIDASWPATGRVLNDTGDGPVSFSPLAISDGAGGAYVVWENSAPRVQHVMSSGAIDPLWLPGGQYLSSNAASGPFLALFPSGPSGFIVAWMSGSDVVLQRFAQDGSLDGAWPSDGVTIAAGSAPHVIADGSGGAMVAWQSGSSIVATHVQIDGTFAAGWPASGLSLLGVANSAVTSSYTTLATGPAGGFVVCWDDARRPNHQLVRARWLLSDGSADPSQPDSGIVVSPAAVTGEVREAISDGQGGVYVAWQDDHFPQALDREMDVTWIPYPSGTVAVPPAIGAPWNATLAAFPNPAHGRIDARFALAGGGPARLELIDLAGRRLRVQEIAGAGQHAVTFDRLANLPPGVYTVRLVQTGRVLTRHVALVR